MLEKSFLLQNKILQLNLILMINAYNIVGTRKTVVYQRGIVLKFKETHFYFFKQNSKNKS